MWEFLSRKKETPVVVAEPTVPTPPVPEGSPVVERATERATEQVNEKYAVILSQTGGQSVPSDGVVSDDASQVSQATDAASRVTQLVELAQVKGLAHAVAVARKLDDLYVLDTMHDQLADKLYEALKVKGLIKSE